MVISSEAASPVISGESYTVKTLTLAALERIVVQKNAVDDLTMDYTVPSGKTGTIDVTFIVVESDV